MPRNVFVDAAQFRYRLYAVLAVCVARHGQQFPVLRHAAVFFDDMPRHFQQADVGLHPGLLPLCLYPQVTVEGGLQVFFREVVHVRPAQSREGAEDEEVADEFVAFFLECPVYKQAYLLLCQKPTFGFLLGDVVGIERVAREPAVVDGGVDDAAERHHVRPHGVGAVVLLRAEEQLEVRDERRGEFAQGDVAHLVALPDEFRKMVIDGAVFQVAALALHLAHHPGVVLVVLFEYGQQRLVVLSESQIGVAYLLRRHVIVRVAYLLIGTVDADTYLVKHAVPFLRHEAAAGQTPGFHVPHAFLHVQLAAELGYLSVHRDAAHHGNQSVLLRRVALEVEQYFECASAHNSTFLFAKLDPVELKGSWQITAYRRNRTRTSSFFGLFRCHYRRMHYFCIQRRMNQRIYRLPGKPSFGGKE